VLPWAQDVIGTVRSEGERDAGTLVYVFDHDNRVIYHPYGPAARAHLAIGSGLPRAPSVQLWGEGHD
jgi:hypothetical protein